jgi:deoxycytidylate deaminase
MDHEFSILFDQQPEPGLKLCAKRFIGAATYANGELITAHNHCEHEYTEGCPREWTANEDAPESIALCKSEHAEAALARKLKERGLTSDGIAWVGRHYWACRPCAAALREVGVREIRVREHLETAEQLGLSSVAEKALAAHA